MASKHAAMKSSCSSHWKTLEMIFVYTKGGYTVMTKTDVPWLLSTRLWLAILCFFGFVMIFYQRVGMSVAIICMVNHTYLSEQNQLHLNSSTPNISDPIQDKCPIEEESKNNSSQDGPFSWNKQTQGHILGAFFYGYVISQIPAGLLAQKFGAKWVFCAFYLLTTLTTLLTPLAAQQHFIFLVIVRALGGIGTGSSNPTMHTLWKHWAPPSERSKLVGITYAGSIVANVITLPIAGVMCEQGFAGGWPSIFYLFGIVSCVWLLLWIVLVADTPAKCRCISVKEKSYIMETLKGQVSSKTQFKTPWLSFVTSLPVWAIVVANFTFDWGVYTFLTNTPTYMYEVLKYDIQLNGALSALPYIGFWAGINGFSIIADKMISTGLLSTQNTRKVFNTVGQVGAAAFILGVAFIDCTNAYVAVILLTFVMTFSGACFSGFLVNHIDIAPQYAGTLMGITNCIAGISGFVAPYVVAQLTQNQTQEEWQRVFFVTASIYVFGAVFYAVFASGSIQSWAQADITFMKDIEVKTISEKETNNSLHDYHE